MGAHEVYSSEELDRRHMHVTSVHGHYCLSQFFFFFFDTPTIGHESEIVPRPVQNHFFY